MTFEELEKIRLDYKNEVMKAIKKALIAFGILILCLSPLYLLEGLSGFVSIFGLAICMAPVFSIFAVIYVLFFVSKKSDFYRKAYKAYFVSDALSKAFGNYQFDSKKGLDQFELEKIGMVNMGNSFSSNDLVIGSYKGVDFRQSDVYIASVSSDSDGHSTTTVLFKGRWIIFDFKKDLEKKLAVVGRSFIAESVERDKSYKKLELESIDFNTHFDVFAQDGFEAYYVLDPAFMERAVHLAGKYKDQVYFAFVDGKVHIAVNDTKDSFEPPSPMKEIDESAEKSKVESEVKLITDIVDVLKLER